MFLRIWFTDRGGKVQRTRNETALKYKFEINLTHFSHIV